MKASATQAEAVARCLDPQANVLVTACAGSGKTWLLTSRIIRALLADPQLAVARILAITFTNAAVAEIQERLRQRLGELRLAADARLDVLLAEVQVRPTAHLRAAARGLYCRHALARPGMMVTTFHGWFMHLERSLPWAARSSLSSQVATGDQLLRDEAWQDCVAAATAAAAPLPVAAALRNLLRRHRPAQLQEMLDTLLTRRVAWELRFGKPPEEDCGEFYATFERDNKPVVPRPAQILADPATSTGLAGLLAAAAACPKPPKYLARFRQAATQAQATGTPAAWLAALRPALHTKAGTPSKHVVKYFTDHDLGAELNGLLANLANLITWQAWEEIKEYNQDALALGCHYAACYRDRKQQLGVVDFADLELSSLRAFRTAAPEEIVARMEHTYSHILIDEFQDTSPSQWEIMRSWLDACQGGDHEPKVFIVGDPKQSIYGFQGGDPEMLAVAADYLDKNYRKAGAAEVTVSFNTTRRCAQQVVDVVNEVFRDQLAMPDFAPHVIIPGNQDLPGQVTVLPLGELEGKGKGRPRLRNPMEEAPWDRSASPAAAEGVRIAAALDGIIGKWLVAEDDGAGGRQERPCRPEDVMLLYPSRAGAAEIARALVRKGIGCASPGGGNRLQDLECQDIISLLLAICDPANALALAQVLRSPLFGASEDDLWAVFSAGAAPSSTRRDDWERGLRAARGGPQLARAQRLLPQWRNAYLHGKLPAHETLAQCYQDADVIARYVRAVPRELGKRVTLNLEWVLNHAIEADGGRHAHVAEYANYLSQLSLLDNLRTPEVAEAGLVRATTVHGAKGLESPVVVVSNAFATKPPKAVPGLLVGWSSKAGGSRLPHHVSFFWHLQVATAKQLTCLADNKAASDREDVNLLYVALTRAKQALLISAKITRKRTLKWYEMLREALARLDAAAPDGDDGVRELGRLPVAAPAGATAQREPGVPASSVPDPASVGAAVKPPSPQARRGTLLHELLVLTLSGVTAEQDQLRYLGIATAELRELRDQVKGILAGERLAELLRQRRRLELELPLLLADGTQEARIDCLLETATALWVIDFKSSATPAADSGNQAQLRNYRDALRAAGEEDSPRRPIRMALVGGQGELAEVA